MPRSNKRAQLLAAADSRARRQGLSATTLADIAEEAEVPLGNLYYYFKTKREIAEAVIDERAHHGRGLRRQWDETLDPRARVEAFIQMVVDRRHDLALEGCPVGSLCTELRKHDADLAGQAAMMFSELLEWLTAQFRAMGQGARSAEWGLHTLSCLQGATLLANALDDPSIIVREARALRRSLPEKCS